MLFHFDFEIKHMTDFFVAPRARAILAEFKALSSTSWRSSWITSPRVSPLSSWIGAERETVIDCRACRFKRCAARPRAILPRSVARQPRAGSHNSQARQRHKSASASASSRSKKVKYFRAVQKLKADVFTNKSDRFGLGSNCRLSSFHCIAFLFKKGPPDAWVCISR